MARPTDEELIEMAYQIAERIGAVHNKHYSMENVPVSDYPWYASGEDPHWVRVSFGSDEPGQAL